MPDMLQDHLAFDRATVREFDKAGHLRVSVSPISKANICPYFGREIPDFQALGLAADTVYQLLRDPAELEKAAASFNGKPLMLIHRPQMAGDHERKAVVGAVHDARFDAPYLKAALEVWDREAINLIESEEQRELSSGYFYRADMTPGEFEGERYDGRMVGLSGNHVALVKEGRAGPDVVVGDAALKPIPATSTSTSNRKLPMPKQTSALSRKALLASGALRAYLKPKLATDAKPDLTAALKGVTAANWKISKPKIKAALDAALAGKLAQDADLEDVIELLDTLDDVTDEVADVVAEEKPAAPPAADAEADMAKLREVLKTKGMSDDEIDAVMAALKDDTATVAPAMDAAKVAAAVLAAAKPAGVTQQALDAAIQDAERRTFDRLEGIRIAEDAIAPFVGKVNGKRPETAEGFYKLALDAAKVDLTDVPPAAYGAMVKMLPKPGSQPAPRTARVAMDAAVSAERKAMFPEADRLSRSR